MATGSILRGPILTGLQDLRCRNQRFVSSRPAAGGCLLNANAPAVSDASWRLAPRAATADAVSRIRVPQCAVPAVGSLRKSRNHVRLHASAVAATGAGGDNSEGGSNGRGLLREAQQMWVAAYKQAGRFWQLSGKFMPMVGLFFMLAFVNTILDSLKDTLVITAAGGGAQVIPYLTVYAVLPSSLIFLLLYSYASQRFRRQTLFNGIVAVFMAFFVGFAAVLYPNHHLLHPTGWAEGLAASLPLGLDGAVGMIRNWTFTLFFCMSELWGDVCLGLLFWGLANDTTSLADAPTLYPLFGLGANVAQALAGFVLKFFSGPAAASAAASAAAAAHAAGSAAASFTSEVQSLMAVVMVFSCLALALHHHVSTQDNRARMQRLTRERARRSGLAAATAAAATARAADAAAAAADGSLRTVENQLQPASTASSSRAGVAAAAAGEAGRGGGGPGSSSGRRKGKQNLSEIYRTLASSVPIRCLVVMSMAQGLCTNLMEFAWKSHIRLLYPTPAEFTSFLGDVSTWQGIVTGLLMVLSPTMFERLGWSGVAAATPRILLYGGGLFFAAAMVYQFVLAPSAASAASAAGLGVLQLLVYGGALLYVFSKSAKFSLFKPAEEMVYISLDEEGRTKGKAAIDVVGSQAGKSGGSVLQQVLLLLCGGAIAGQLPVMVAFYLAMSQGWLRAVSTLATVNNYGHASSVHESMQGDSLDHDDHDHHHHHEGGSHHQPGTNVSAVNVEQQLSSAATVNGHANGASCQSGANGYHRNGASGVAAVEVEVDASVQQVVAAAAGYANGNGANGHHNSHANGRSSPNGNYPSNGTNGIHVSANGVNGHTNGYKGNELNGHLPRAGDDAASNGTRQLIRDSLPAAA